MSQRVVITGMGICSCLGAELDDCRAALTAGDCGIKEHPELLPGAPLWVGRVKNETLERGLGEEEQHLDRTAQMAIVAARAALQDSGEDATPALQERTGLILGTSHGGRSQMDRCIEEGSRFDDALSATRMLVHAAHYQQTAAVAAHLALHGPTSTISSACSSSGMAIAYGSALLRAGRAERVIAGGSDAFSRLTAAGFRALRALASGPCSPFSERIGLSLGEGAGFVVLETLERARARGAHIYAELAGYGLSWDAHHLTEPHPTGAGLRLAMTTALKAAGIAAECIDYVHAHGTGTRANDAAESLAIKSICGVGAISSATKSATGHTLGASTVIGLILSVLAREAGVLPGTLNFGARRTGCELDYVPGGPRPGPMRHFLVNSAGFGGANAVLACGSPSAAAAPASTAASAAPATPADEVGISGIGLLSAIGLDPDAFTESLRQGKSGIAVIQRFDTSLCGAKRAALIENLDPRRLLPTLELRRLDRVMQYATLAAAQALARAGLRPHSDRIGIIVATCRGAAGSFEKYLESVRGQAWQQASAVHFPNLVMSATGGHVSRVLGLRGAASTVTEGVSGGLHALIHGYEVLRQSPELDAMVVVAADEICPMYFRLFDQMGVLAGGTEGGMKLYQEPGSGMVLGEGAVALVLERKNKVRQRGGKLLAEVQGYGLSADSAGYQRMETEGKWLSAAVNGALQEAGGGGVDVVYGHGRGIGTYDHREVRAVGRVIGGKGVPLGCVMGNTGVAEASSGLFSVVAAVQGMQAGEVYPVIGGEGEVEGVSVVRGGVRAGQYRRALVAGSTESGNNAALVLALPSQ